MKTSIKAFLFATVLVCSYAYSPAQNDWVFHAKGLKTQPVIPTVFNNVEKDGAGNVYLSSSVIDSTTFGSFTIHGSEIAPGIFLNASYLAKLNSSGDPQWVKTFPGTGQFYINDLTIDNSGNPIAVGLVSGKVNIGGTEYESNFSDGDFMLVKFNPSGDVLWTFMAGSQAGFSSSSGISVDCNASNDIIVSGYMKSNVQFGDTLIEDANNMFLATFTSGGNLDWARLYGNIYALNNTTEVAVDANNNICWVGVTADENNGNPTQFDTIAYQAYSGSMFLGKFESDGDVIWLNHYGESPGEGTGILGFNATTDATSNAIIISGIFRDTVDIEGTILTEPTPTGTHLFVARFNSDGSFQWAKQSYGVANGVNVYDIDATPDGSVFVGMRVSSNQGLSDFTLGDGSNQKSFEINGAFNGVLAKYKSNGDLDWVDGLSGFGSSPIFGVDNDGNDACFITGIFSQTTQIGDSSLTPGPTANASNVFVARISSATAGNIESNSLTSFEMYPNPTGEYLNFRLTDETAVNWRILDQMGRAVLKSNGKMNSRSIDVSKLKPGLYLFELNNGNQIGFHKFTKL